MNWPTPDEQALLAQARAALLRAPAPPESVYSAVRDAAQRHAAQRSSAWIRWWSLWRRAVFATGGSLAALLTLLAALPGLLPTSAPRIPAESDLPAATLALIAALADEDPPALSDVTTAELLARYLLRLQETPGGFESAHDLYASAALDVPHSGVVSH